MKGIAFKLLYIIIIGIIFVFIIIGILFVFNTFSMGDGSESNLPKYIPKSKYDNSNFILDISSPSKDYIKIEDLRDKTKNEWFCRSLTSCIKKSLITGKSCEFAYIIYGEDLEDDIERPFVGKCDDEELTVSIAPGVEQKICEFKEITDSTYKGDDGQMISDTVGLSLEDCTIHNGDVLFNEDAALISGEAKEEFSKHNYEIYNYFSPDYSYEFMDYDTSQFYVYNGASRAKLAVGKVFVDESLVCRFTTYLCPQSLIATSENDQTLNVFDNLRTAEIRHHTDVPYYIRDISEQSYKILEAEENVEISISEGWSCVPIVTEVGKYRCFKGLSYYTDCTVTSGSHYSCKVTDAGVDAYIFNTYYVPLDKDYHVVTIINAIKYGLYENFNRISQIGGETKWNNWAAPHWDIQVDKSIEGYTCWDENRYGNIIKSNRESNKERSIYYNCGSDNRCDLGLAINIGWRRDYNSEVVYDSGIVTFCELDCVDIEEDDVTSKGGVIIRDANNNPEAYYEFCIDSNTLRNIRCTYTDIKPKGVQFETNIDCRALGYTGCKDGACYK